MGLWCWLGLVELGSEIWCCLQRAFLECSRRATHKELCFVCEARGMPVGRQLGGGEWVGPATSWSHGSLDHLTAEDRENQLGLLSRDVRFKYGGWGKFSQPSSCLAGRQGIYPVFSCRPSRLLEIVEHDSPWPRQINDPDRLEGQKLKALSS